MIHMISGGATDEDSGRARKAHGRRLGSFEIYRGADLPQDPVISFGSDDLRGVVAPHNDALVVTATVASYDVARIFIDNGSSVNILFKSTLDQMKVEGSEFEPISTPLYGFAGHAILPLRRPALKDFIAVASTYHQKLKFPVGKGVGVLCGDQKDARRCYERIVKEEGKRARVEVNMIRRGRSGLPVVRKEVMDEELEANLSGFAWSAQELIGTTPDVAEHRLNTLPNARPVKQKKRHFGPEKDKFIRKEVGELLEAGHIREGYHQIPLAVDDQDKVSFITSEGTFCYAVMSFGLKNAGATYQRLMDKVFSEQVGRNVELYVDDIMVYLSATKGAVSSVLVKLEESTQQPVYYVSHALKGAEIRYLGLEKLALALVMTARRLRSYFLSHLIVVLTNSPLGRILTYSDMSGRLVKWTTELGEYDIKYEPRTAIKAQALADFLAETVHQKSEDPWKVYVDGSLSKDGSGVGVVLISPTGEEVKLAARLDFRASNNEAEYEAVLAGLRAARNVRATKEEEDWRTDIIDYLRKGKLPNNPSEARKLKTKCSRYVIVGELLYRTSFASQLLRCLSYQEADYVLREIHEGCCGNHLGAYALARKVLLVGYCCPSVLHDAQELVMSCDSCQRHAQLHHQPPAMMKAITTACPFDQCGMDIVVPFPIAPAQKKFQLVAVDYFSKWVEAEPLVRINENDVLKFLWKSIVCRDGVPRSKLGAKR
ncbi:uncharacterized protein [Primulina huaijiensis]|uniref:uncharacterized protein n=1 Tax=Primulina huaijiensis TaxID=1492673 RepID=UPI003CC746D0